MKHRFLLSAAAAASLVMPAAALAAPPPDRGQGASAQDQQDQGQHRGKSPRAAKGEKTGTTAAAPAATAGGPTPQGQGQGQGRSHRAVTSTPQTHVAPAAPTVRRTTPTAPRGQIARRAPTPQVAVPPPTVLGQWNRTVRGPERDQYSQQWRQSHQGWDSSTLWRRSPDWWRHDSGFRLFFGPRIGFFFFPEYGYVSAPAQYRNHYWRAGEYLPNWFWRYRVRNYRHYGLPRPPDGCMWIWLDGDVALIDRSDGYIIDIVRNLW